MSAQSGNVLFGKKGGTSDQAACLLASLDFPVWHLLTITMRDRGFASLILALILLPQPVWGAEPSQGLSYLEIAERLVRLEEGQTALRADIKLLREDMNLQDRKLREDMNLLKQELREDMNSLKQDIREDMNIQFDRHFNLILAVLGAFTVLVAATISFAFWDRRTMTRPFEEYVKGIKEELAANQSASRGVLEALRALGQRNPEVATILKNFNL